MAGVGDIVDLTGDTPPASPIRHVHVIADSDDDIMISPEEFAAIIRADLQKWGKVVREMGIKPGER